MLESGLSHFFRMKKRSLGVGAKISANVIYTLGSCWTCFTQIHIWETVGKSEERMRCVWKMLCSRSALDILADYI